MKTYSGSSWLLWRYQRAVEVRVCCGDISILLKLLSVVEYQRAV